MYYILKNDGTFLFELPYPLDFCLHCLFNLIDSPDPNLKNCHLFSLLTPEDSAYSAVESITLECLVCSY